MIQNDQNYSNSYAMRRQSIQDLLMTLADSNSAVGIYAFLCLLQKIKQRFGLVLLLEYTQRYIDLMERRHPRIKQAILKELQRINVGDLYREEGWE